MQNMNYLSLKNDIFEKALVKKYQHWNYSPRGTKYV